MRDDALSSTAASAGYAREAEASVPGGAEEVEARAEWRLIRRAQAGDERALGELYRAHYDLIYRYVAARLSDSAAVEDVVSSVFVGMVQGLSGYRWTGRPFAAWLYGIAKRQVIQHYRSCSAEEDALGSAEACGAGPDGGVPRDPRGDGHHSVSRLSILSTLEELPESQSEVVLLRTVLDLSVRETARLVDRSEDAVKQLHRRGLHALATRLPE